MTGERVAPEISARELVRAIEEGEDVGVLDIRAPHRLAAGTVDLVARDRFFNVRGSELLALADPREAGLDPGLPLVVVCGHGNDSRRVAGHLAAKGYDARSLAGGIVRWMETVVPRELAPPAMLDRFVQLDRVGKGALAYALASDGEALVVDPPRRVEAVEETLASLGARLVGVADTHAHADYVSGGPALAAAHDVPYYLHPRDAVSPFDGAPGRLAFEPLEDGRVLRVGRAAVTAVHTPGHTEGSTCLRLGDDVVLSGDFVFVRSIGRPDLGGRADAWTKLLWRSLERARAEWPDDLLVFPAHYAGEAERRADRTVAGRFGDLRRRNEPLAIGDEAAFAAWVRARAGAFPDAYRKIKLVNLGLETVGEEEAEELEAGRNECALG